MNGQGRGLEKGKSGDGFGGGFGLGFEGELCNSCLREKPLKTDCPLPRAPTSQP